MRPIVTLLTDFGTKDPYVASMKGVILSRCADVSIVDLSHEIPPQDVFEGALFLAEAASYFPPGTVHCVVVDPGVGTARLPIALEVGGHKCVAPDNGVLSLLSRKHSISEARMIANREFMLESISATFHGRDIFAPAAAALAAGNPLGSMGDRVATMTMLDVPRARKEDGGRLVGVVMHIDRFGNAITNILREDVGMAQATDIRTGHVRLAGISETYADVETGQAVALFGSSDYLEIAVNCGNAHTQLGLSRGNRVEVRF
ncbi:MAG: SAM-dependent chlorinase/fluorinase [Candidatus Hydrogenedentes bacterium]|nr:SAM-dependent chlorinase/fluorinase [Candidatus Hydrogenedentota bacterium]